MDAKNIDLKQTINLPRTDFPMKANLPVAEPKMLAAWEQALRTRWRALLLCIKAKLESVESGIETFDTAFMAQIVLPDGRTVEERVLPEIEKAYLTGVAPTTLMLEAR